MVSLGTRFYFGGLVACCLFMQCSLLRVDTFGATLTASKTQQAWQELVDAYFEVWPSHAPIWATQLGDHRFDARTDDVGPKARQARVQYQKQLLNRIDALETGDLDREDQVDLALFRRQLNASIWKQEVLQEWAWNPLYYAGLAGNSIYSLTARDFAPIEERLRSAAARLRQLPRLMRQARYALDPKRVPAIHAQTAASQNRGLLTMIKNTLEVHLDTLSAHDRETLQSSIEIATQVIHEHQRWLEEALIPHAKGDYRLGKHLYDQKLKFTLQSALSREAIRDRGEQQLRDLHDRMYDIAKQIYQKRFPYTQFPANPSKAYKKAIIRSCLEIAYQDRPTADQVVEAANDSVRLTEAFIREKDIITLPPDPLSIIVMPEFRRGVSLAYCDSPGPLEVGLKTFYAVSPPPSSWTSEQVTSHLREYNRRSLHNLTIHEAMPGHFVQLAHANRNPRKLRSILGSGTFVEGWAVYCEWMMCEEGFLEEDLLMRLIVLKWYLRDVTNALLDQAVHVDGIQEEEAMRLLMEEAFQEEREAAGKWRRAKLTSAQLSTYYVGYLEQIDLRQEAEERWGAEFKLKSYHDRLLSYGSIPAGFVRALLFDLEIPSDGSSD